MAPQHRGDVLRHNLVGREFAGLSDGLPNPANGTMHSEKPSSLLGYAALAHA
jgi:hypothetical protein